tara:strand:+ start:82 stop:354 length:273 start_codon:yes stop_codon:yes gene_type:complete
MPDIWVVIIVFAFMQGPGVNTTPLYFGESPTECAQSAESFNETNKALEYKKAVCLKMGTVYNKETDETPEEKSATDDLQDYYESTLWSSL